MKTPVFCNLQELYPIRGVATGVKIHRKIDAVGDGGGYID